MLHAVWSCLGDICDYRCDPSIRDWSQVSAERHVPNIGCAVVVYLKIQPLLNECIRVNIANL